MPPWRQTFTVFRTPPVMTDLQFDVSSSDVSWIVFYYVIFIGLCKMELVRQRGLHNIPAACLWSNSQTGVRESTYVGWLETLSRECLLWWHCDKAMVVTVQFVRHGRKEQYECIMCPAIPSVLRWGNASFVVSQGKSTVTEGKMDHCERKVELSQMRWRKKRCFGRVLGHL